MKTVKAPKNVAVTVVVLGVWSQVSFDIHHFAQSYVKIVDKNVKRMYLY